jgi:arylsulfatase A-like enzyme
MSVSAVERAEETLRRPPKILILWGDDIGYWNISTYNQGTAVNFAVMQ